MRVCYGCDGRGWVSDGGIDDGRQTGRETCPVCKGARTITDSQLLSAVMALMKSAPEMSEEEQEAQRRSFAFGNANIDNPNVTREMVDEAAERLRSEGGVK